jgi:hypothetical protein
VSVSSYENNLPTSGNQPFQEFLSFFEACLGRQHCQRLRNRSAQQQHGNDHSTPPLVVETIGYLSSIGGSSLRTDCAVGIVFVAVTRRGDSLRVID